MTILVRDKEKDMNKNETFGDRNRRLSVEIEILTNKVAKKIKEGSKSKLVTKILLKILKPRGFGI